MNLQDVPAHRFYLWFKAVFDAMAVATELDDQPALASLTRMRLTLQEEVERRRTTDDDDVEMDFLASMLNRRLMLQALFKELGGEQ